MEVTGLFEVKSGGFGFVRSENGDIFIPAGDKNGAMHGQTVRCDVAEGSTRGRIVSILSAYPEIVGSVHKGRNAVFVVPENPVYEDVFIPKGRSKNAKGGDKVVVKIDKGATRFNSPEGAIVEILGSEGDAMIDIIALARSYGLNEHFKKEVEKHARGLKFLPDDTKRRLDLRKKTVFTMDGDDAKDLDDAVSIEKAENGNYLLGVHIADVTHYVKEDDVIDKEALKRGTSVYLLNKVIPMLPKTLSNDLCSLNAGEDKLTLSCIMEVSKSGEVVSSDIKESVINSKGRLTYNKVNAFLEGNDDDYEYLRDELLMLSELTCILRKKREEKGSIDFELGEMGIETDENGYAIDVYVKQRGQAEKMIEECMLLANMTVAETFRLMECPFVYRVHEKPDGEKIRELSAFLSGLGIPLKGANNIHPKTISDIIRQSEDRIEHNIINKVILRSMKKAVYDCMPKGHFGLSAEDYCHFTSPIRRYPDLCIHRIIKTVIGGGMTAGYVAKLEETLPNIANISSERERNAVDAERALEDKKAAEFMQGQIGERFFGVVSGVTNFGMFVETDNMIDGMVPFSEMTDDYYELDRENYRLVGERTGRIYRLGDAVSVICTMADPATSRIEFILV